MSERARIVRLLSPEEVRDLRAGIEKLRVLVEDIRSECSPDDPYQQMMDARDLLTLSLIHTVQAAWETIDRLQGG